MQTASITSVLSLLMQKGLLADRLKKMGLSDRSVLDFLRELHRSMSLPMDAKWANLPLTTLAQHGLVRLSEDFGPNAQEHSPCDRRDLLALNFVQAVNFELTYSCNMSCPHCLQSKIRQEYGETLLDFQVACRALETAWFCGLTSMGVNFTGGEPLQTDSNIFQWLDAARALRIGVRLNTNSWWGDQENFTVGGRRFARPGDLVAALRGAELSQLAVSFDVRFKNDPGASKRLAGVVYACEKEGLPCQIVCTGKPESEVSRLCAVLRDDFGIVLRYTNVAMHGKCLESACAGLPLCAVRCCIGANRSPSRAPVQIRARVGGSPVDRI